MKCRKLSIFSAFHCTPGEKGGRGPTYFYLALSPHFHSRDITFAVENDFKPQ